MRLVDRYIIYQLIKTFLFSLLCFILIFILVDLFENLDKFIDNKLRAGIILDYYFSFIPEIIRLVTPISVLLATLFTVGRLINYNEIIAVKNSGVSLLRFMLPFLLIGLIITGISIYFNNWVVPMSNKNKFFIERNFLKKNIETGGLNKLYFQDSRNQFIFIGNFDELNLTANKVSVLLYNKDTAAQLVKRIDAKQMKWIDNKWVLFDAVERILINQTETIKSFSKEDLYSIQGLAPVNLVPSQITKKRLKPDELDYGELNDFIDAQRKGGQHVDRTLVDFYSKISFPFSSIIVIVFGIAISTSSKRRKGLTLQFGISILISFIYLGFTKISQTFGYNGDLNPVLTAWLANIAFLLIGGTILLRRNY